MTIIVIPEAAPFEYNTRECSCAQCCYGCYGDDHDPVHTPPLLVPPADDNTPPTPPVPVPDDNDDCGTCWEANRR